MAQVTLTITEEDFAHLHHTSMQWAGYKWEEQTDRFFPLPDFTWKHAYWAENYSDVLLMQAFLGALGHEFQLISDESEAFNGWVILTNYLASYIQEEAK